MLLSQARVVGVGPVGDLTFPFADDVGVPRKLVVLTGGGGVGKTSVLAAIASTRPGLATALPRVRGANAAPFATTDWILGDDDPTRPHPLRIASPNAPTDERDEESVTRRREQVHFDRRATEGGYAFMALSGGRWFSRSPILLSAPDRSLARYDVRGAATFDDATRADIARETKTTLTYAAAGAALGNADPRGCPSLQSLERALREALSPLLRLGGVLFVGADPMTLEPIFAHEATGSRVAFDELPTYLRHLAAFAVLPVRMLYAAYAGKDPRLAEGVVAIDDVDLHQDTTVLRGLAPALREALPNVQWILTSSSSGITLGCSSDEVLALRRMPDSRAVELYEGELALVH